MRTNDITFVFVKIKSTNLTQLLLESSYPTNSDEGRKVRGNRYNVTLPIGTSGTTFTFLPKVRDSTTST